MLKNSLEQKGLLNFKDPVNNIEPETEFPWTHGHIFYCPIEHFQLMLWASSEEGEFFGYKLSPLLHREFNFLYICATHLTDEKVHRFRPWWTKYKSSENPPELRKLRHTRPARAALKLRLLRHTRPTRAVQAPTPPPHTLRQSCAQAPPSPPHTTH